MSYNYLFKFILIGDTMVGKTCILNRFITDKYLENQDITIGVEFGSKHIKIDEIKIKLQIWDTAGQECYTSITRSYYRGAAGCLLVFDLGKPETFNNIKKWLEEVKRVGNSNMVITLIGNKSDAHRKISYSKALNLAKELKLNYIETSAFSSNNIDIAFFHTAKQILENIRNNKTIIDDKNGIKLGYQHTNNYIEKYKYEENNVCC
jgi:Ras-related protein Rab-2A